MFVIVIFFNANLSVHCRFFSLDFQSTVRGSYDGNQCIESTDCPTRQLKLEFPFACYVLLCNKPRFLCVERFLILLSSSPHTCLPTLNVCGGWLESPATFCPSG